MKQIFFAFALATLWWACGNSSEVQQSETDSLTEAEQTSDTDAMAVSAGTTDFKELAWSDEMLNGTVYKGKDLEDLVLSKAWTDANGTNVFLMIEREAIQTPDPDMPTSRRTLRAYHYVGTPGNYKLVREIKDETANCGFDIRARFDEKTFTLSDIDHDGYAEITFVYRLGCTSDLSPDELKLMMLENGDKYAIRGNTSIRYEENAPLFGGETKVDPSFDKAPEGFLAHARQIWDKAQMHTSILGARELYIKEIQQFESAKMGGVEPNWTVRIVGKEVFFKSSTSNKERKFEISDIFKFDQPAKTYHLDLSEGKGEAYTGGILEISFKKCSDGMSDNEYPLTVRVNLYIDQQNVDFNGCGRF